MKKKPKNIIMTAFLIISLLIALLFGVIYVQKQIGFRNSDAKSSEWGGGGG